MDIEYIKARVAQIESMKGDPEAAHSYEDQLLADFIALVAEVGTPELAAMATEVLKTEQIRFARWCA